jgi:hypothetical protein
MAKAKFTQADLQRALRAAKAEGIPIERIEIEPGKIIVITRNAEGADPSSPFDEWRAKRNARTVERH